MVKFLRNIHSFLNEFNTTSGRIVATVILAYLTAIRVLFLDNLLGPMQNELLITWCMFLGLLGGFDIAQFRIKRKTYIPQTEETNEVSNGQAITGRRNSSEHDGVEPTP